MQDIIEQIDDIYGDELIRPEITQEMFDRIANFIIRLEPDQLNDYQLQEAMEIIEILDEESVDFTMLVMEEEEDEYTDKEKRANKEYYRKNKGKGKRKYKRTERTEPADKLQARVYKRKNRQKIKIKKRKLVRSAEGRRRIRMTGRLEKVHMTPTKRKKVRYNPVRKKRAKNRPTLTRTKFAKKPKQP